jgi:hypothetical protein
MTEVTGDAESSGFNTAFKAPDTQKKILKLRTVQEVLGEHFPVGPFPTEDAAVDAIRKWASNPALDGGAFGI